MKKLTVFAFLAACLIGVPESVAGLVAYYNFNDASDENIAWDSSGNENHGEIINALYTDEGEGHTEDGNDRAMDMGFFNDDSYVDLVTASEGAFDSLADTDQVTISVWTFGSDEQPVDQWTFYAGPDRQLGSHTPWSNGQIYFDVAGTPDSPCCDDRISAPIAFEEFAGQWNNYIYTKEEDITAIYINGELLIEGFDMRPMNPITEFFIGAGYDGDRRSYSGLIDDFAVWDSVLTEEEILAVVDGTYPFPGGGPTLEGDFNGDNVLDDADINSLTQASAGLMNPPEYDLTGDDLVNGEDITKWVKELYGTWIGDANLDGEFNSGDFVAVFTIGKYETGQDAVWTEGDWNGDGIFGSGDFVTAFTDGGYEQGPLPAAAVSAVPEPASALLLLLGLPLLRRRK